jgi:hypothetical protein
VGINLGSSASFCMCCKKMLFLGSMHFHMVLRIV